jgi:UDP-N-acetyl-D-mannosaminuronic acid dehydrogenase
VVEHQRRAGPPHKEAAVMDIETPNVCIIGGAGRIGLPLGIAFARVGVQTTLFDTNPDAIAAICAGRFPFKEEGVELALPAALSSGNLRAVSGPASVISESQVVVLVLGTPVDEYLNPNVAGLLEVIDNYLPHFRDEQILLLRSTVYPGTSERLQRYLTNKRLAMQVAFCPERVAEGDALQELADLPQIVSAFDNGARSHVRALFEKVTRSDVIELPPFEAELSKLFSNVWRYIKFAVANEFYTMATQHRVDYSHLYEAMIRGYARNRDLPRPGFAAGPCLFRDTMQLAAFSQNRFFIGHAAMLVNEGLPHFLIEHIKERLCNNGLIDKTIGILGMTFKANSDDPRDSLSFKLRKIAAMEAKEVLCHDPYLSQTGLVPLDELLERSDVIILAAPHREYLSLDPKRLKDKIVVDIWRALR